ncbi:hypothetical protein BATDEDRAFT_86907 [Batrachochytrium dendrobatidis JAM81]|uniref:RING-type domain-containing protein n=1 Tax=Batrachochytrium dendrobatidis (strain JAM81 / FGSC 10211) TaxID=684364 RepID=F4NZ93_BATDJ|nr:uncharacterized protein BATDEDRAFT_86907 [Batrachochytrium dendrobatidis JAM81]EGF82156.1 hypothetical protein BATDEDRAFT_86907 [Batrachochytrium dendrobatidis JAM81]|eukprot:XP_006677653.1 hypothetical protein BATDEDRAFT_86907 [Batrachochytrium dendrobatidis JAM81]
MADLQSRQTRTPTIDRRSTQLQQDDETESLMPSQSDQTTEAIPYTPPHHHHPIQFPAYTHPPVQLPILSTAWLAIRAVLVMVCRLWLASLIIYTLFVLIRRHHPAQHALRGSITSMQNNINKGGSETHVSSHSTKPSYRTLNQQEQTDQSRSRGYGRDLTITIKVLPQSSQHQLYSDHPKHTSYKQDRNSHATPKWLFSTYEEENNKPDMVGIPALFGSVLPRPIVSPLLIVPAHINGCRSRNTQTRMASHDYSPDHSDTLNLPKFPTLTAKQKLSIFRIQKNMDDEARCNGVKNVGMDDAGGEDVTDSLNGATQLSKSQSDTSVQCNVGKSVGLAGRFCRDGETPSLESITRPKANSDRAYWGAPIKDQSKQDAIAGDIQWACLIARGGCPFDEKVYNLQTHGCHTVIVYNNLTDVQINNQSEARSCAKGDLTCKASTNSNGQPIQAKDMHIRMSAHTMHNSIHVYSMFMSYASSRQLIDSAIPLAQSDPSTYPIIIQLIPTETKYYRGYTAHHDTLVSLAFDMLLLFISVTICGSCFLGICLLLSVVRNAVVFGHFFIYETIIEGSVLILSAGQHTALQSTQPAKLASIPFPVRILCAMDIENLHNTSQMFPIAKVSSVSETDPKQIAEGLDWAQSETNISRDCCAICLDDFVVGNQVRELPCRHLFHDMCIDPWLLKHNRLCPICKRDVLVSSTNTVSVDASVEHHNRQAGAGEIRPSTSWFAPVGADNILDNPQSQHTPLVTGRMSVVLGQVAILIPFAIAASMVNAVIHTTAYFQRRTNADNPQSISTDSDIGTMTRSNSSNIFGNEDEEMLA